MKFLRITLGIILVVFGFVALVTPLTPGAWLALIGLELLGFGFLVPKKLRDLWEKSSAHAWLEKKNLTFGCPPRGSQLHPPASPRASEDNRQDTSPPSA